MSRLENSYSCFLVLCLFSVSFSTFVFGNNFQKYETFTATDKTKWIQVSQLEQIFFSLEGTFTQMGEKQKQDSLILTQLSKTIESFGGRLQNIEDQLARIDRAESYNKIKLQQFSENFMKNEFQNEQINFRVEKIQKQFENRLNDVDSNLEKMQKTLDNVDKEIRRVSDSQNKITSSIDDIGTGIKSEFAKIMQNVTSNAQELRLLLKNKEHNSTIIQADATKIDNQYLDLKNQFQSLDSRLHERMDTIKVDDMQEFLSNYFNTFSQTMKQHNDAGIEKLEGEFKKQSAIIINEQLYFKNNCHRLQVDEERIEIKVVDILNKLFDHIDNRTHGMTDRLAKLEFAQSAHFKNQSQDLDNLKNAISFYVLRNSTNSSFDLQKTLHQLRSNLSFIESTLEIMQKNEPKNTESTTQAMLNKLVRNLKKQSTTAPSLRLGNKDTHTSTLIKVEKISTALSKNENSTSDKPVPTPMEENFYSDDYLPRIGAVVDNESKK